MTLRRPAVSLLPEPYYTQCNELFRRSTNQTALMLDEVGELFGRRESLRVLSAGSGVGLFEMPMLENLRRRGVKVDRFVGVDVSAHACAVLSGKLTAEFGQTLDFEVVCQPFQDFTSGDRFDIVLFNHTFEYLSGRPITWIRKSQKLLRRGGSVVIFSPERDGINRIYDEATADGHHAKPIFADDIEGDLSSHDLPFLKKRIVAACDVSLLHEGGDQPERLMLLSFLTQQDCRHIAPEVRHGYVEYFLSLRDGGSTIPHPTALFVV